MREQQFGAAFSGNQDHAAGWNTEVIRRAHDDAKKEAPQRARAGSDGPNMHRFSPEQSRALESFSEVQTAFAELKKTAQERGLSVQAMFAIVEAEKKFKAKDVAGAAQVIWENRYVPDEVKGMLVGILQRHEVDVSAVHGYENAKQAAKAGMRQGYDAAATRARQAVPDEYQKFVLNRDDKAAAIADPSERTRVIQTVSPPNPLKRFANWISSKF